MQRQLAVLFVSRRCINPGTCLDFDQKQPVIQNETIMKTVNQSMYAQIIYMVIAGSGFLFMPQVVLPMFGMQAPQEVWIRILGLLALVFAYYYLAMTQNQVLAFFKASVWGRFVFCGGLAAVVLLGLGEKPLLLFAAVETALAVWTYVALKRAGQL